jgi:hypothetical protein
MSNPGVSMKIACSVRLAIKYNHEVGVKFKQKQLGLWSRILLEIWFSLGEF